MSNSKNPWKTWYATLPGPVRKAITAVVGAALITIGLAAAVLPGPFTIPLLIAGTSVLAAEYAWAKNLLKHGEKQTKQLTGKIGQHLQKIPWPITVAATTLLIVAAGWTLVLTSTDLLQTT